jgi:hypothetical protein
LPADAHLVVGYIDLYIGLEELRETADARSSHLLRRRRPTGV